MLPQKLVEGADIRSASREASSLGEERRFGLTLRRHRFDICFSIVRTGLTSCWGSIRKVARSRMGKQADSRRDWSRLRLSDRRSWWTSWWGWLWTEPIVTDWSVRIWDHGTSRWITVTEKLVVRLERSDLRNSSRNSRRRRWRSR